LARSKARAVALDSVARRVIAKSRLVRGGGNKPSDRKKSAANKSPKRLVDPSANRRNVTRSQMGE